jgi:ABC-type oligopeptide transport system substrate-binding subunit
MRQITGTLVAVALVPFPAAVLATPEGQIVIAQGGDPSTLDSHMHAENFTFAVVHNVFDHLVRRSVKNGQLAHDPGLAASWTTSIPRPGSSSCARASSSTTARSSTPRQ